MMDKKTEIIAITIAFIVIVPVIMMLPTSPAEQSNTTGRISTTANGSFSSHASSQTTSDISFITTTAVFLLRHGGYHFSTITTVGNKIEVVFKVYDWMPAPMVIIYKTFTITYPETMTPIIVGVAYHYDKSGKIVRTEILPPGGVLDK